MYLISKLEIEEIVQRSKNPYASLVDSLLHELNTRLSKGALVTKDIAEFPYASTFTLKVRGGLTASEVSQACNSIISMFRSKGILLELRQDVGLFRYSVALR